MSDISEKDTKKIPGSILVVGTIQVAVGLWAITTMAITGEWVLLTTVLAVGYTALGAGLLAIMEWARFGGVVIHPMILVFLLARAGNGAAGLNTALQVSMVLFILYILTRPEIRAKFRRTPAPSSR